MFEGPKRSPSSSSGAADNRCYRFDIAVIIGCPARAVVGHRSCLIARRLARAGARVVALDPTAGLSEIPSPNCRTWPPQEGTRPGPYGAQYRPDAAR